MNKQKNYRRRQRGITPITTPRNSPGVAQFSMSEVAQFSVSLDSKDGPQFRFLAAAMGTSTLLERLDQVVIDVAHQ